MTRRLLPGGGLFLVLLFLLIYIVPLGARPLIIPDEVRYAEIPREMIATGDWAVPRLAGLRYFEKPVMGYWMTAAALKVFGQNPFGARFTAAASAGLSALIIFLLVRRFGHRDTAFAAAAIYLSMGLVMGLGVYNVLDGPLSLFVTAAMASFFTAVQQPHGSRRKVLFLVLCGLACGCGFLTKGFVAFAVPAVAAFPYMIWQRRFKELLIIGWIPFFTALLTVIPWALLVHQREPDFWRFFIFNEHLRRFMDASAQHRAGAWYYLALLPVAALPWTVFAPTAAAGLKRGGEKSDLLRWAVCWFVFPLLFFSVARGKILTYILPCFAPLAVVLACGFHRLLDDPPGKTLRAGTVLLALFAVMVAAALVAVQLWHVYGLTLYSDHLQSILVTAAALLCGLVFFLAGRQATVMRIIAGIAAAPVAIMLAAPIALPDATLIRKAPCDFLQRQAARVKPTSMLVADERLMAAVCWVYRRSDVRQLDFGGELSYGLSYKDAGNRMVHPKKLAGLIRKMSGRLILVISAERWAPIRDNLPKPSFETRNAKNGFVFLQF
jgi:4-amino-4-deoxy-L-arabinose transferase